MVLHTKRLIAVYCLLLFGFWTTVCRLYTVSSNVGYATRARNQTITTLQLGNRRGDFYDRNGVPLTGVEQDWYALCIPGENTYTRLFDFVDPADQKLLYSRRNAKAPFLVQVEHDLADEGVFTVPRPKRYADFPLCPHLIGYLDGDAHGVSGLESAMDEVLQGKGEQPEIRCVTNARGGLMPAQKPQYLPGQQQAEDVQLTIDSTIQAAVEGIGLGMMDSGAIVVLDVETAQVLACASFPMYSQQTVAQTLSTGEGALMNRAFSAYAVGSVFKPLLAAAALEEKISLPEYTCPGYIRWYNHVYRCAGGVPHGEMTLQTALEKSCNGYFVQLGHALGGETLLRYAKRLGFGQPVYLTGGLKAAAGNLPGADRLENAGALANFSFGQGELLATPVQVAAMMNTFAADGVYRVPGFLLRGFDAETDQTLETLTPGFGAQQVFSKETAARMRQMLASVVENGLGKDAAPTWHGAGGKTGTAQTGRHDPETGKEYVNLWFAGFCPTEKPRYTVVVMQDDQTHAKASSAAVFARVCDALSLLDGDTPAPEQPDAEQDAEKG